MIILEFFFAFFVIAMMIFGKMELSSKEFKLSMNIAGRNFSLFSIRKKGNSDNDNVSI